MLIASIGATLCLAACSRQEPPMTVEQTLKEGQQLAKGQEIPLQTIGAK